VDRRAKNVLIHLEGSYLLLVHQKISGRLVVGNWERTKRLVGSTHSLWQHVTSATSTHQPASRFIHLVFELDDGRQLALSDLRKFAKLLCGPRDTILNRDEIRRLGPEPLDPRFTFSDFKRLFEGRTGRIKPLLMNPNFIAGIGNIYSDEILYAARIHPMGRVDQLAEPRLRSLYRSMRAVLQKAIRLRGTGIEGSRDSPAGYDKVRMVYHQKLCPKGHVVHRIRASGRSAHFCPLEQKLYRHAST
jgi:formamidopyrimidine-DNA glycosylase